MTYRQFSFIIAAVLAIAATAPALALGDGPAVTSDWGDLTMPQSECFARGEAAIQRNKAL